LKRNLSAIARLLFFAAIFPLSVQAQEEQPIVVQSLNQVIPGLPAGELEMQGNVWTITNGAFVQYGDTVLTADSASVNQNTGETVADGHVRIEMGDQIWLGDHINYNFKTHQMRSEQFRSGKPPVFAAGENLQGDISNKVYTAQHVFVTADDVSEPAVKIRASRIQMVPGQYIEAWNAVLFVDGVPSFYYPYYRHSLGEHPNELNFTFGDSTAYGPYLLPTYRWWLNDRVDGALHAD
jgi:lipopolysaccharide assembly outer membrane protein LptD (OstA)